LIDFGLCTEVDLKERNALTSAMFHLLTQDFESLVSKDAKDLGFLPDDFDTSELKPLLTKILTVGLLEASGTTSSSSSASTNLHTKRKRKLQDISNELNEVFFRYPFSVPPFFALVTRGLGLLEGIALTGDPDFDIFQASAPYARRRALSLLGNKALRAGFAPTDHATK
jgi:predicted unusual protein kinase regulating ubiquinone biosynthesis (AarF/ABC1/UbiB family)